MGRIRHTSCDTRLNSTKKKCVQW